MSNRLQGETPASIDSNPVAAPTMQGRHHPFLAIIVPVLNEEKYIAACLASLISQWPQDACEILVLDGGSTDRTADVVQELRQRHPHVRLIANPKRIQSAAMNLGASLASPRASLLLRADAHAVYPRGFIQRLVTEMLRTGATSVVVPMRNEAQAGNALQNAIAVAQSSRIGNGGAAHRSGATSDFVEHGHHAIFDRAFFQSIGGYDEQFTHNEDAEHDLRAIAAGGRIWMCADSPVIYFPRTTLRALGIQYMRHGRGRARTLLKHRLRPKPRQMAPVAALLGCVGGLVATPFVPAIGIATLVYPLLCLGWGTSQAIRHRNPWLLASGAAVMVMHMGWAIGFLRMVASADRSKPVQDGSPQTMRPLSLAADSPNLDLPVVSAGAGTTSARLQPVER